MNAVKWWVKVWGRIVSWEGAYINLTHRVDIKMTCKNNDHN